MDSTRPIDIVLSRLGDSTKGTGDTGRQWKAICPAHNDHEHSLSVGVTEEGRVLMRCFAGCPFADIASALGMEQHEFFAPMTDDDMRRFVMPGGTCGPEEPPRADTPATSVTLAELSADKGIPLDWLRSQCYLDDAEAGGVTIPYFGDKLSQKVGTKRRTALKAKDGSYWQKGKKLAAYGIWRLPFARGCGFLILVEGESDCWSLWYHDFPGLGIPGANAVKQTLLPRYLEGIKRIYVWQEPTDKPGTGGEAFANSVSEMIKKAKWQGEALVVSVPGVKDPNVLHQREPERFRVNLQKCLDSAVPLPPPVSAKELAKRAKAATVSESAQLAAAAAVKEKEPAKPGFFPATDWGNARRLAKRHGDDLLYCHPWRKWMVWDGQRFCVDDVAEVMRRARDTVYSIYGEALKLGDEQAKLRTEIIQHAVASEAAKRMFDMVKLAESEPGIAVKPTQLDTDGWLFNVINGTVDLRSGQLRPHSKADRITKLAPIKFDPDATCPQWEQFLSQIMDSRRDVIEFLQLAVGYSLTAATSEKCLFFLYGSGDNGKSVFIETLACLMGEYWMKTPTETVMRRNSSEGVPNDVARLVNMRMVSAAEVEEGKQLNEARIKDITGGDTISARFMRAEWFDFVPVFKLWMYGNHKPVITGCDDAIWNRLRLIPFNVTIAKDKQDRNLKEKLKTELPGILNWAIRGCLRWQREGLGIPLDVKEATQEYRQEQDVLAAFLGDCCVVGDPKTYHVGSMLLYDRYVIWCKRNGEKPHTHTKFADVMKNKGFLKKRLKTDNNHANFFGVSLGPEISENGESSSNGTNGVHDSEPDLKRFDF
jgi:putative DNA primase/helicase